MRLKISLDVRRDRFFAYLKTVCVLLPYACSSHCLMWWLDVPQAISAIGFTLFYFRSGWANLALLRFWLYKFEDQRPTNSKVQSPKCKIPSPKSLPHNSTAHPLSMHALLIGGWNRACVDHPAQIAIRAYRFFGLESLWGSVLIWLILLMFPR